MAQKYSNNEIPNFDADWGQDLNDEKLRPYSNGAVQRFLKSKIQEQMSTLEGKIGWLRYEGGNIIFYDKQDGNRIGSIELSGTIYAIELVANVKTNFFVLTTEKTKYISITPSSKSGTIGGSMNELIEDYTYVFSVDNGNGVYKEIKSGECTNGNSFREDIRNYITTGTNRIRVIVTGKESNQSKSIIFTCSLTNLQLTCNMSWYKPFIQGLSYSIDKIYFGGNMVKTLYVKVDDETIYNVTFPASSNYLTTEYNFNMSDKFPSGGSGIHTVEIWMGGEGVETQHYKYNIMCVAESDINQIQLVCLNEAAESVKNYNSQTLFKYATYNATSVMFNIYGYENGNTYTLVDNETLKVQTQTKTSYDINVEVDTEIKDGVTINVNATTGDCTQSLVLPLDNSNSYAAVDNPTFYLNCTNRSNGAANREEFINSSNNPNLTVSSYSAVWNGFAWSTDGWAIDGDGNRCLAVNAGSSVSVPDFKPLASASVNSMTIEFKYRCSNVADFDTPILSFMDTETYNENSTNGIILFPTKILVLTSGNRLVTPQSVNLDEDKITHIAIVLQRNYNNIGRNLCRIYVNSYQNAVFEFDGSSTLGGGYLRIGQQSADTYLYMMRWYNEKVLEESDVLGNFLNVLTDDDEYSRASVRKANNILDSGEISYDMCKKAGYNIMTIQTQNDIPLPSIEQTASVNSTLKVEYNDHPEWNFTIENAPLGGQGTTSMKYYRWNFRWKLKDAAIWTYADNSTATKSGYLDGGIHSKVNKITAKKNYASSMQGHKMGACGLYDELYDKLSLKAALPSYDVRVAVYQYPVVGFQKLSDGTYKYVGQYTIGPDKGDSKTFGYDKEKYPNFLSLEGPNHNPLGTRFLHPWTENTQYNSEAETLEFGGQEGWDVDACPYETDVAEDQPKIQALLEAEWKPAYDIVYYCSPYIISLNEAGYSSISQLNNDKSIFRNSMDILGNRKNEVLQLYDSSYNLIYYDNSLDGYKILDGFNMIEYLNGYLSTSTPSTDELISARKAKFKAECGNYWSIDCATFHSCFCELIGASDNHAKNSYPFKFKTIADGGRWCWRQDDLDTILATDNNGQSTKSPYIEPHDITSDGTDIFQGASSAFWTLIDEVFAAEKKSMMTKLIDAMSDIAGDKGIQAAYLHDTVYNVIDYYLWQHSSEYFPSLSYNKDATWSYITPWSINPIQSYNNVYPLTQALGTQKDAEQLWMKRRIAYVMSQYQIGGFTGSQHDGYGSIEFTPARSFTFNLIPCQDLYPCGNKGGGENIKGKRTKAGEVCQIVADSDGSTTFYIKSLDLLTDIGDLSGLRLTTRAGDSTIGASFSINGAKLRKIKVGDVDASKVEFNASSLSVAGKSLEEIDARNVSTITNNISLLNCPRLKKVHFEGTNATTVILPQGAKITEVGYPSGLKTLFLHSLPLLETENIYLSDETVNNITGIYYYNCPKVSPFDILRRIYNEGSNLRFITMIWDNVVEGTSQDLDMIANFAHPYVPLENTGYGSVVFDSENGLITNSANRTDLQGTIVINGYAYKDSFDTLKEYFGSKLEISCLGYYIRFKDNVLLQLLLDNNYGDGIGITYEKAETFTSISNIFSGNTDITSFDELKEFKNVTTCPRFYGCKKLVSIDCSNITVFNHECLRECNNLTTLKNLGKFTITGSGQFLNCYNLQLDKDVFKDFTDIPGGLCSHNYVITDMNLQNAITIGGGAFSICKKLKNINIINCEYIGSFAFDRTIIEKLELNKITTIENRAFEACNNLKTIIIRQSNSVPKLDWGNKFDYATIYVPDSLVEEYKVTDYWSYFANNIKPLSEYVG